MCAWSIVALRGWRKDSNGWRGQCRNVRIESPHVAQLQPSQCVNVRKNVCRARVPRKPWRDRLCCKCGERCCWIEEGTYHAWYSWIIVRASEFLATARSPRFRQDFAKRMRNWMSIEGRTREELDKRYISRITFESWPRSMLEAQRILNDKTRK